MTSKKALTVWVFVVFAFIAVFSVLHAWFLWQIQNVALVTVFSFPVEITNYFIATLMIAFVTIGAVCYAVFSSEQLEMPLYRLRRDFEEKLDAKSEEIKGSTDEALTKLSLKSFQVKDNLHELQNGFGLLENKLKEGFEKHEKILNTYQEKTLEMGRKIDSFQSVHKELAQLEKRLDALAALEKNVKTIQGVVERLDFVPEPFLCSSDDVARLEGKMLKTGTVRLLKSNGINKVEDLLLKSPVEIALTDVMSESEAKNLQSVLQLLMIPGVGHDDAVLLLKSGVNSRQELAAQDTLGLGARLSKVAELYVKEGKIKENDRPTLEEIASWIKLAKAF